MPTLCRILNPFSSSSSSSSSSHTPNTKNAPPSTELQSPYPTLPSQLMSSPLTVIELFQSQGCNSCPPANNSLLSLLFPSSHSHSHPPTTNTLLLSYEVSYWDHLGWASTFGNRRWDARQRDYARVLDPGRQRVYTPQVLVDGGAWPLGGNGWRGLSDVLKRMSLSSDRSRKRVGLEIDGEGGSKMVRISGGDGNGGRGDVAVVFYEEMPADVRILRGENRGEVLRYRNVVRDLVGIGQWDGEERMFEVPERRKGLEMVVLVQSGRGGEILGAVKV